MYIPLVLLAAVLQKPAFANEAPLLKKLAERVQKDGQESAPDLLVDKFLELKGKKVRWCAPYDSERQVQLFRHPDAKPERLIFVLPEKPFPEFGKVWVYSVSLDGKLLKAGLSNNRKVVVRLDDSLEERTRCRKEIQHWIEYFSIKKT